MDATTVMLGTDTRDTLASYRDRHGYPNYNEALSALLQEVDAEN
jgi:hypothetical protein